MTKRLSRVLLVLLGVSLGIALASAVLSVMDMLGVIDQSNRAWNLVSTILYTSGVVIGLLLSLVLSKPVTRLMDRLIGRAEVWLQSVPPGDLMFSSIGVILGLTIAILVTSLLREFVAWVSVPISAFVYLLLGYVGGYFGAKRWRDLPFLSSVMARREGAGNISADGSAKVLDTSAIIDGRIVDIARAGFLEGPLIVPFCVLEELRHIADSPDELRRKRGRRGLDVVSELQKEARADLRLLEMDDSPDSLEVDVKLLKLAAAMGASVLTTDYNLNKVAQVSGVSVLNIHELANAVKQVLLPGERLTVQIVRAGKEPGQGLAYLEDGTMVVIENGRAHINQTENVLVTSVLQTAAGRMVFTRIE